MRHFKDCNRKNYCHDLICKPELFDFSFEVENDFEIRSSSKAPKEWSIRIGKSNQHEHFESLQC